MTKAAEIRELSDDELVARLGQAKHDLFQLRFQNATGQLENAARIRTAKRDIARLNTILRQREIAAAEAGASA